MQRHHIYRRSAATGWTRIEMLLALYDATLASLDSAIAALNCCDQPEFVRQQIRATNLLLTLLEGIDSDSSPANARIRDLCVFCIDQISRPAAGNWQNASDIISLLRDGFLGIRQEAIELEARGEIPRLSQTMQPVVRI